ncbi:MAG: hypothetical protein Q8P41_13665 [Pseudomonadota bacterium]|nr:hypothetical protein [Pseudomonadota bacterium]
MNTVTQVRRLRLPHHGAVVGERDEPLVHRGDHLGEAVPVEVRRGEEPGGLEAVVHVAPELGPVGAGERAHGHGQVVARLHHRHEHHVRDVVLVGVAIPVVVRQGDHDGGGHALDGGRRHRERGPPPEHLELVGPGHRHGEARQVGGERSGREGLARAGVTRGPGVGGAVVVTVGRGPAPAVQEARRHVGLGAEELEVRAGGEQRDREEEELW